MKKIKIFLTVCWLVLELVPGVRAGQYFQDFSASSIGATNFSDGSQLFSTTYSVAEVTYPPYNELQLTANGISEVTSAYELPDLDFGAPIYAFSAKWNMPVYGNYPNSADGFSFNFGALNSVDLTNGAVESGYGTGLSFDVQTYAGNNPGFYIRVGTNVVASVPYNPQTEWGVNNGARHLFEVDWNYYTGMTVNMDGTNIFANVAVTNFIPAGGERFVFAARCGGDSEFIRLDNIVVFTGGNLTALPASGPYFSNGSDVYGPAYAFDGILFDYWQNYSSLPTYVGATYLPTNAVAVYALTSANAGNNALWPQSWTLQGSANGGGSWTNCGSGSGYFLNPIETRYWPATNTSGFSAYRLNVTTNAGGSETALGELRMYALSAVASENWQNANVPAPFCNSIACSANGAIVYANSYNSVDSGKTWIPVGISPDCHGVSCSYDGQVVAVAYGDTVLNGGNFQYTINGGMIWNVVPSVPGNAIPHWVAVSGNGNTIMCMDQQGYNPVFSTNSGASWQEMVVSPPLGDNFFSKATSGAVAVSADGTQLFAVRSDSHIWHSADSGQTWSAMAAAPTTYWGALVVSADGQTIVGAVSSNYFGYGVWISTNAGTNFSHLSIADGGFNDAAISADGKQMLLASTNGSVYESFDTGAHWTLAGVPNEGWYGVACSTNGSLKYSSGKEIWKATPPNRPSGNTSAPLTLTFNSQYPVLSWPTPGFRLQSNTNLASTNWLDVPYPVQLNPGSIYQVTDVPGGGAAKFYQLKSP